MKASVDERCERIDLYRAISQESAATMAAKVAEYRRQGYRKFQLKVGGDPDTDIDRIRAAATKLQRGDVLIADANTGWTQHAAVRVADAVRDADVNIEQPCYSYEECLAVRRHTNRPFVLDEVIDSLDAVVRGIADQAMDVINLKISKVGGLPKARQIRDLCVSLGVAMTIEDSWCGDITTAAIAHLAHMYARAVPLLGHRLQLLRLRQLRRRRAPAGGRLPGKTENGIKVLVLPP